MTSVRGNPVAWESFYKTARWRRLREFQLAQHPLCKFCLERGIVTAANVFDHVTPHQDDWTAFVTGAYRKVKAFLSPLV
jgi:5-methylcytosine-specific restriction endonuclease McrA